MDTKLFNILNMIEDVVCLVKIDSFELEFINSAVERILGINHESCYNNQVNLLKMVHSDDQERVRNMLKNIRQAGTCNLEFRVVRPDGKIIWLGAHCAVNNSNPSLMTHISCVLRDITERKQTELQLLNQLEFQELIAEISRKFVNVHSKNLDAEINSSLELLGRFLGAEHGSLYMFSNDKKSAGFTHKWFGIGAEFQIQMLQNLHGNLFLWGREKLQQLETFTVPDVSAMTGEAAVEKEILEGLGIKSFILVPLFCRIDLLGFLFFAGIKQVKQFDEREELLLNIAAEVIGNAISRVRAEEELYSEKERLAVTLKAIGDGVIVTDRKGNVELLNSTAEMLTGWKNKDACGEPVTKIFNIVDEKTRSISVNPVEKVIKSGFVIGLANHTILIRQDGTEINIDDSAAPICDSEGKITGTILVFRDITEKRKAELEMHLIKERLEAIFEASPIPIIVLTAEGYVKMWNKAAERIYGWKEKEVVGSFFPIVQEEKLDEFRNLRERVLRGESFTGVEVCRQKKDGSDIWISISSAPLHDVDGNIVGIMYLTEDITERKKMVEALKESEEKFRLLAENARDLIYKIKFIPQQRFEYMSPSIESLTGYKPDDFYADPYFILKLVHPDDKHLLFDMRNGVLNFERPVEIRWLKKDGQIIWLEQSNKPIYDENGNVAAVEGIARDITNRKNLEQKLKDMSMYDSLTGLYNRAYFEEEMQKLDNNRFNPVGFIVIDVDGLKAINDAFGHETGDAHLKLVARLIQKSIRKNDILARIGGDEFAVLLPHSSYQAVKIVAERIKAAEESYNEKSPKLPVSISLGFAVKEDDSKDMTALFQEADDNMYRQKLYQPRSSRSDIVQALAKTLEARDYITEGHAERLKDLVVKMGRELGLSEERLANLRLLAQFHDIGKVGISDNTLFKPGQLEKEERRKMQRHAEIGNRIANSSPRLAPVADFILKHHEWWNGEGYPFGLKGEEIPLECRILAVVDAYDAMTNDRPYRKAMSREEAAAELKKWSGTQFDPEMVSLFLKIIT